VPDLKDELRQLADDAARRARPTPAADVIQEGDRRQRRTFTPRRRRERTPARRRWPGWAVPVAAATAVLAVIAVATIVSGAIHGRGTAGDQSDATVYVGYTIYLPPKAHNHLHLAGEIVPISSATNTPGKPIPISTDVGDIATTPDGKTIYVASGFQPGTITPISTATNAPGRLIRISGADGVAITPNGNTAYVSRIGNKITPVNTSTNTPGRSIHGGGGDITFTPDSKTAYVVPSGPPQRIVPIRTATNTPEKPIRICHAPPGTNPGLDTPQLMAITPDGKTLYAGCTDGTLTPISTATNTPGKPIHISGGMSADTIAFTPDSKTAYIGGHGTVTPVSTATNTAGKPIRTGLPVVEVMAMTPDGKTLYVTNYEGRPTDRIVPISTATNRAGPPIHVANPADALAITPDGKTLYAATGTFSLDAVTPINTATNRAGKPILLHRGRTAGAELVAITP
jgi:DNA-binding beta-propeller fold protein YncE